MSQQIQKNLKELLEARKLTVNAAAKLIGISQSTLSRIARGESEPTNQTLALICAFFAVNPQRITGLDEPAGLVQSAINVNKKPVPLLALQNLDLWDDEEVMAEAYINAPADITGIHLIATRVLDSALAPDIKPGDVLYLKPVDRDADGLRGFQDGLICAGITTDINGKEQVVVRKVLNESEGRVWLRATNPEWPGKRDVLCERIVAVGLSITRKLV